MRKLLIVLALFAVVSASATSISECWKNHQPPDEWSENYPKGIAGRTIFYAITTDPGPEYFGWDDEDPDFIAMKAIISNYETWYALRMGEVADIMEDFEADTMNRAVRGAKLGELNNLLYGIDIRFMDDGDLCWAKVPEEVQDNYIEYMEE